MTIDSTSAKAVLRNIFHGFSAWILPLFLSLLVTRVVVRSLGTADYGIYALVLGFVSYSFNFSIGRAITKFLAGDRSTKRSARTKEIISATILLTISVAAFGSLVIIVLSRWLVTDVFTIEASSQEKSIVAIRLAAAIISALMVGQIGTAVFQGLQRFDVYSKIQNATSIVTMLGNLVFAYLGYGLLSLLYWNLAATIVFSGVGLFAARSMLDEFGTLGLPGRESVLTVLRYSASVIGYQAIGNAFFLFERGWIISKLGADELTYYSVPMSIGLFLPGFILSLSLVVFPLTSGLAADRVRLIKLYQTATRSVMLVVLIVVISLIACGKLFLTMWLGADFGERSADLLAVQSVAFGLAAIGIVAFQTAEGLGHPAFNFRNTAISALAALVLAVVLIGPWGSLGVAYSRVAFFLIPLLAVFDLERRYLGGFHPGFWFKYVARLLAACVAAYLLERAALRILPSDWITLIVAVGGGIVSYGTVLLVSGYLSADDRTLLRQLAA